MFLVDDLEEQLKLTSPEEQPKHEQQELQTIGQQIATAERNLSLAEDSSDFKTVSAFLKQLRGRESTLREKLSKDNRKKADLAPEIVQAIQQLKSYGDILNDWPNVGTEEDYQNILNELAVVFKRTISSITVSTHVDEFNSYRMLERITRRSGVILFDSEHVSVPDVILTDDMLGHPNNRKYKQILTTLRTVGRPALERELADLHGHSGTGSVRRFLAICKHEGLVKREKDGWVLVK